MRLSVAGRDLELVFPRPGQVSVGWGGALAHPSWAVLPSDPIEPTVRGSLVEGPGISVEVLPDGGLVYRDAEGRVRRRDDGWRTTLPAGASVHGLGGRGQWRLQGRYRCWNTDPGGTWLPGDDPLYVTTPAYLVLDGLGAVHCFIDNPGDGFIEVTGKHIDVELDGPMRWHVSIGTVPEVMAAFTELTGRPSPPPRWALGYHQARWGYGSASAVREVVAGYRRHSLPLSAMHLDIDHMDRYRNFTFGPDWPDPAGLVAELADSGVRTVVIVDAGTAKADDYEIYRDGLEREVYLLDGKGVFEGEVWPGPTVFPDFTRGEVRRWWGDLFARYTDLGVAGFWHDMNEPTTFREPYPLAGDPKHNIYGQQMMRASYEGLLRLRPDQRPFLFSRSGWAGMQRWGGNWSGDIGTDWSSLGATIHQAFSLGVAGIGYYGSDIGGFSGSPSPELFTRWFQLMSFLPFFRTHCAFDQPRREPWEWGEDVLERVRLALRRRYRLLPYWYSLALSGRPYVRPLAWLDPALRGIDDEFLVGDDVLVAPVLDRSGARRVRLPAGTWFHGDTGQGYSGEVELSVGLDDLPWFVRAGSAIPTEEDGRLELLVAPGQGESWFLTDAGDGWDEPHEERLVVRGSAVAREVLRTGSIPYPEATIRTLGG